MSKLAMKITRGGLRYESRDSLEHRRLLRFSSEVFGIHSGHFFLKSALKKFGWRVESSVFHRLGENDTIEIYGRDLLLKVVNLRFIQLCTYPMEAVFGKEFSELFRLEPDLTGRFRQAKIAILRGQDPSEVDLLPEHEVFETWSSRKRRFWAKPNVMAPVFGANDEIVGVIFSATVEILGEEEKVWSPAVGK